MRLCLLLCGWLLLPWMVGAESFALRHVELLDGTGGVPLRDATVWVEDGKIRAAGLDQDLHLPAGLAQLNLRGKTLLSGLVSDHSHVGLIDGLPNGAGNYTRELIERQLRHRAYGVTTVSALGMNRPLFYRLRAESHAGQRGIKVADGLVQPAP